MTPPVELSIVIVSWNVRDVLLRCLESLRSHPPSRPWEVIVVDNGSVDGTAAAVASQMPWVRLVANRDNRGLAAANNQGMLAAEGDTICISNPDVLYHAGAFDELCALLDRRPRAAVAVARLLHPDGSVVTAAGDLPRVGEAMLGRFGRRRAGSDDVVGFWWWRWAHDEERRIGRGAEACYAVRRAAVVEVGVQDERFVLDWEGIEWSARLADHGWEIWFCPTAEVVHLGGESIRQARLRWVVGSHRGMYRYFAPRVPGPARPLLAVAVAVRGAGKFLVALADHSLYERRVRASKVPPGATR